MRYELRCKFDPQATLATVQTQLAVGIGPRYTATVLSKFWGGAASLIGRNSIFASEREATAVLTEAKGKYKVLPTPFSSPPNSPLHWSRLETAGAGFTVLDILQLHVDTPEIAPLVRSRPPPGIELRAAHILHVTMLAC